jgi:hypothetical protein
MMVFCAHFVIDQPQTGASGVVGQGRRHGPSMLGHSPLASQSGRRVGPDLWPSASFAPRFQGLLTDYSQPHYESFGLNSVADLDPYVFGPPGPGSVSQR